MIVTGDTIVNKLYIVLTTEEFTVLKRTTTKKEIFTKECNGKECTIFCESTSTGSRYLGGVKEAFHRINSIYINFITHRLIVFSQNIN